MNDYMAADWQRIFAFNGLHGFDDFWNLEAAWFEEPNERRGGWSGVARCELKLPGGDAVRVFLKRQENHTTRTLAHPFRGIPTFVREFRQILRYRRHGIPSLTPLYFACRSVNGERRAILLTEELAGYRSLEEISQHWRSVPRSMRVAITTAVARLLRQIHSHRLTHDCFYPKHVFIRAQPGEPVEARVIDLEKTKWRPMGLDRNFRDIRRLIIPTWTHADRVRFIRAYLGIPRLTSAAKVMWRRIAQRHLKKGRTPEPLTPAPVVAESIPDQNRSVA
jgi:hypothetical protein